MTVDDIKKYFGSVVKAAEAIGVKPITIWMWVSRDSIPYSRQLEIEKISKGTLRAFGNNFSLPAFRYFDNKFGMCRVKSITFSDRTTPLLLIKSNDKRSMRKYASNLNNLMQASPFVDELGLNLFEKDIILISKKEVTLHSLSEIYSFFIGSDLSLTGFKIIGNIFEGKIYGHKED